jgi:hypothetical protein
LKYRGQRYRGQGLGVRGQESEIRGQRYRVRDMKRVNKPGVREELRVAPVAAGSPQ